MLTACCASEQKKLDKALGPPLAYNFESISFDEGIRPNQHPNNHSFIRSCGTHANTNEQGKIHHGRDIPPTREVYNFRVDTIECHSGHWTFP